MSRPWAILRPRPKMPDPLFDAKSELLIYRVLAEHEGRIMKAEERLALLEAAAAPNAGS